jgi:uncharacterized protein (DUF2461 family)
MVFWEGPHKKTDNPGFFIRIEPGGAGLFVGQHGFPKPMLAAYRDAVAGEELGGELEGVLATVRGAGAYAVGGEHYKRVPRGYDPDHARADLLRYNGLWAFSPRIEPRHLTSADLVDLCFEHCANMAPLHHWLVKVAAQAGS